MVRLTIGFNVKGKKPYDPEDGQKIVEAILNKAYEGYTIYRAVGCYKAEKEHSIVVELDDESLTKARLVCARIKRDLQQECIRLEKIENNVQYI